MKEVKRQSNESGILNSASNIRKSLSTGYYNDFNLKEECRLLLVEKEKAHGLINKVGDFSLKNNIIKRWKIGDKILYYSGIQIISLNIFKDFSSNKFSFNAVWDNQIKKNALYGNMMSSHWYHVGEINGLKEAINSDT